MLIGNTGAGKSTLINGIVDPDGIEEGEDKHGNPIIVNKREDDFFAIGHDPESCTLAPKVLVLE